MNRIKNKKIIYALTSSVAVLILCVGVFVGYNKLNNNEIGKSNVSREENGDYIIFNNKSIKNTADIDGKWEDTNLTELFDFIKNIEILGKYNNNRQGKMYVRENIKDTNYSQFQQYSLMYFMNGNNAPSTEIIFTKENEILACMLPDKNNFTNSIISGKQVKLFKTEHFEDNSKINGEAFFEHDGYKFYVESHKIDENDFINMIKQILGQNIVSK